MSNNNAKNNFINLDSDISYNIHKNVNQDIIIMTEDKAKLVLMETKSILSSQRDWVAPLGLFVSFIATLLTAEFKDFLGFKKDFYWAMFCIATLVSFVWLLISLYNLWKNRGKGSVDYIIRKMKMDSKK